MELLGRHAKRRRSKDLAAGEPPATEATEASNSGPTTHSQELPPPPPPPDAGGGDGDDDGVDRISGLPDAVLGEILSLLSTKEAGRTQILASRWRHVWLASPLILDGTDLLDDSSDSSESDDEDQLQWTLGSALEALEGLASAVTHILSIHPGPGRRFCIPSLYLHDRPATVDAWLSSPALDNLDELDLGERYEPIWDIPQYRFRLPAAPPASTFRFSATLRAATLEKCELPDSSVEGINFPLLKQLGLQGVSISEGPLHSMISSCPVLECLLFKGNIGVGHLRISSNSLRSIGVGAHVYESRGNPQILQEVIIVDAPCLERFLYFDAPSYSFKGIDLTVISAPKLETLGCLKEDLSRHPRLVFGTTEIQGLDVVSLTTALSTVKTLAIASDHINLDMVIELMKCFPCLEKLYIKSSISREMNRWCRKHKDFIKSFDIRLKTIMLKQYRGTGPQVNFASFFLRNARELESMILDVGFEHYNEAFFTKQHGKLQMEKRASRGARLHFTKKTCTHDVHVNHVRDLSIADPFECRC